MILSVDQISKSFGSKEVLRQVSFQARSGSALGLLGRNGAGKTTTIRIIMQVFPPDGGSVTLDGHPLQARALPIGYLPEEKGLYPKQKIGDQLIYLARLRGLSLSGARKSVQTWLERLGLSQTFDQKLETLSKGNQQKIQLALALLADPVIVILDEPFSGLDPVNAQLLKDIVNEQVKQDKVVLFSSHQMNYVEQFCDDVAILHQGEIKVSGSIRELKRNHEHNKLWIRFRDASGSAADQFSRLISQYPAVRAGVLHHEPSADGCLIQLRHADDSQAVFQALAAARAELDQYRIVEPTLEEIFVEMAGDA